MSKIVITTSSFGEYDCSSIEVCKKEGYEVIVNPYKRKLNTEELVILAKEAVGIVAGTEVFSEDVLLKLPGLKVISRCGAGIDNIALDIAKKLGIKIYSTPDAPTLAVAELTVGVILSLLRKINQMDAGIRNGKWQKMMGNLLNGKKIGIIGFGRIGQKLAELLKSFDCQIAYNDPFVESRLQGLEQLTKESLLEWADIVSVHVSIKNLLLGEKEMLLMKKGSWLINISRGGVVDELALYKYLYNGHLSGAALDVFEREPYDGPLTKLNNVILTPHIGSYAREARIKMELEAASNLLKGLKEGG